MEQIPKIVTRQLGSLRPSTPHPDADVLAAFLERSLSSPERESVLQHLSACGDCREVLALATPAAESMQPVIRPLWSRGPVLRWAALAACAVVVVAAVSLRPHHNAADSLAGYRQTPAQSAEPAPQSPAVPLNLELKSKLDHKTAAQGESSAFRPKAATAPDARAGSRGAGDKALFSLRAPAAIPSRADAVTEAVPAPSSRTAELKSSGNEKVELSPAPAANTVAAEEQAANVGTAATPSGIAAEKSTGKAAGKAKDQPSELAVLSKQLDEPAPVSRLARAGAVNAPPAKAADATAGAGTREGPGSAPQPAWTLTASGTLTRSFDHGASWQPVPVDGKSVFHALSAIGADLWIGGNNGSLYHSDDGGAHWTQFKPSDGGKRLTGDIVGISADDARHVRLQTADHQSWSTGDGGATWQMQSQ